MRHQHGSSAALRSPAHITLVPPFRADDGKEDELANLLGRFASGRQPFTVELENFGAFPPRVIYVAVKPSAALGLLHKEITDFFAHQSSIPIQRDARPFVPHLTIATRDLSREQFDYAWSSFSARSFTAAFQADRLSLLKFIQGRWELCYEAQLV